MNDRDKKEEDDINLKLKIAEFTEALKANYSLDAEHDRVNTQISIYAIGGLLTIYNFSSENILKYFGNIGLAVHLLLIVSIILFARNIFLNLEVFKLNKKQIDLQIENLINGTNNLDHATIVQVDKNREFSFKGGLTFGLTYAILALGSSSFNYLILNMCK
jgi:hypothetical protein